VQVGGDECTPLDIIKRWYPLQQLSETIGQLAKRAEFRAIKQGVSIVYEDADDLPAFVVVSGRVSVVKASSEGKELNLGLIPPNDLYSLMLAIDEAPPLIALKAQRDSIVLVIPRQAVRQALDRDPQIYRELNRLLLERVESLNELAFRLAHQRVEVRIAAALLAVLSDFGVPGKEKSWTIHLRRLEPGSCTGTTAETAIRMTKAMGRDGVLARPVPGSIEILYRPF